MLSAEIKAFLIVAITRPKFGHRMQFSLGKLLTFQ